MYWRDYLLFLPAILACLGFSIYASLKVRSTFSKYNTVRSRSGLTGYSPSVAGEEFASDRGKKRIREELMRLYPSPLAVDEYGRCSLCAELQNKA